VTDDEAFERVAVYVRSLALQGVAEVDQWMAQLRDGDASFGSKLATAEAAVRLYRILKRQATVRVMAGTLTPAAWHREWGAFDFCGSDGRTCEFCP
jgi:hypothetical protein